MSVIFLDLDSTLIDVNSSKIWIKQEYSRGNVSLTQLLRASWMLLRYRFGATELESALEAAAGELRGWPERQFRERLLALADRVIDEHLRPEIMNLCALYRARGDSLVLLTSASQILAERVAERLELDAAIGNSFTVDGDGLLSGALEGGLVFGVEKIKRAEEFLHVTARGAPAPLSLRECAFYSDSYSDLPLLEQVGRPRVVCPDRRLKKVAEEHSWPILEWGVAGATPLSIDPDIL